MALLDTPTRLLEEIADLWASGPSPGQLLDFRPSAEVQQRARQLLSKSGAGQISAEEQRELDQYEQAELLMQMVKARLRANAEQ